MGDAEATTPRPVVTFVRSLRLWVLDRHREREDGTRMWGNVTIQAFPMRQRCTHSKWGQCCRSTGYWPM